MCKKSSDLWKFISEVWEYISTLFDPEALKEDKEVVPGYVLKFAIFFRIFVGCVIVVTSIFVAFIALGFGIIIGPVLAVVGLICPNLLDCENRWEVLKLCSFITAISGLFHLILKVTHLA